jgi:hypothetical protein
MRGFDTGTKVLLLRGHRNRIGLVILALDGLIPSEPDLAGVLGCSVWLAVQAESALAAERALGLYWS